MHIVYVYQGLVYRGCLIKREGRKGMKAGRKAGRGSNLKGRTDVGQSDKCS